MLATIAFSLTGCISMELDDLGTPSHEIPSKLIGEMAKKGVKGESPVLVRIFKQESELEVWKIDRSGRDSMFSSRLIRCAAGPENWGRRRETVIARLRRAFTMSRRLC